VTTSKSTGTLVFLETKQFLSDNRPKEDMYDFSSSWNRICQKKMLETGSTGSHWYSWTTNSGCEWTRHRRLKLVKNEMRCIKMSHIIRRDVKAIGDEGRWFCGPQTSQKVSASQTSTSIRRTVLTKKCLSWYLICSTQWNARDSYRKRCNGPIKIQN